MFAYSVPAKLIGDSQINMTHKFYRKDNKPKCGVNTNFAYWRKFSALHTWMQILYETKGGTGDFNCQQVRLMPEDIDDLEEAAKTKSLRPVSGFFFGYSDTFSDEDKDEVLEFVDKCRKAFKAKQAVIYDSWW